MRRLWIAAAVLITSSAFAAACRWGVYDGSYSGPGGDDGGGGDGGAGDGGAGDGGDGGGDAGSRPIPLISGEINPELIAVGGGYLFWNSNGNLIKSCQRNACATTVVTVCGSGCGSPPVRGIFSDGTSVYWTSGDDRVLSCPAVGCAGQPVTLAGQQFNANVLASDGTNLYWTKWPSTVGPLVVMKCALGGCLQNPSALTDAGPGSSFGIATKGGIVYWTTGNAGTIESCATSGCASPFVVATIAGPGAIVLHPLNDNAYFTGSADIYKCSLAACNPMLQARSEDPQAIVVDATNVYWTNGIGLIRKCNAAGCNLEPNGTPVTLADQQMEPRGIAVDADSVYWANRGSGTIMKLPIPK